MNRGLYGFPLGQSFPVALESFPPREDSLDATPLPQGLQSPLAWYDAFDFASLTISSDTVTQWSDKSGNGYHLTSSGSNAPGYGAARERKINNIVILDFVTDDIMANATIPWQAPLTLCLLHTPDTTGTFKPLITDDAGGNGPEFRWSNGNAWSTLRTGDGGGTIWSYTLVVGSTDTIICTAGTVNTQLWVNGFYRGSDAHGKTFTPNTGMNVGRNPTGSQLDGGIAEIIIYDFEFIDAQAQLMNKYFKRKWGTP